MLYGEYISPAKSTSTDLVQMYLKVEYFSRHSFAWFHFSHHLIIMTSILYKHFLQTLISRC